jgi:hypothetical protein
MKVPRVFFVPNIPSVHGKSLKVLIVLSLRSNTHNTFRSRFVLVFGGIIFVLVSWGTGWDFARGLFTALSFVLGACTSIREFFIMLCISSLMYYFV